MSNYNREIFEYDGAEIVVGSEDVNGTGDVSFRITEDDGTSVVLHMPYSQASQFGGFIIRKADEARTMWHAEHSQAATDG